MPFDGLRVLSLESRRAKEMEALILRNGGEPFIAPSVKETGLDNSVAVVEFVERLEAGEFDMVICMTGTGMTFLREAAVKHMPLERLTAALSKAAVISRGPKPAAVLRALKVPIAAVIPEPNTWKEIVQEVERRTERRIAVQEHGRPNEEMNAALEQLGATAMPVVLYRWELPEDLGPLREAIRRLVDGRVEVVLFTSSIQLDHLLEVAREMDLSHEVRAALGRVAVASVGPVMTAALESQGVHPAITPKHPKMAVLVKAAADQAPLLVRRSSF